MVTGAGIGLTVLLARSTSLGLLGIHERAALLGGSADIESTPGGGTTIFVRIPVDR